MKLFHKGDVSFVENSTNWTVNTKLSWNSRTIKTTIISRKLNLSSNFKPCKLSKSNFFILLSYILSHRSESYSFYGAKSKYANVLLKSIATIPLMEARNAKIELKERNLIYSGSTKKKDLTSLSNVFILNETLIEDIDSLEQP